MVLRYIRIENELSSIIIGVLISQDENSMHGHKNINTQSSSVKVRNLHLPIHNCPFYLKCVTHVAKIPIDERQSHT